MTFDRKKALETFDNFLMIMDDQLDYLNTEAIKHKISIDFSLETLEKLETLFDLLSQGLNKENLSGLIVLFARHLGEIVRLNSESKWILSLEDEKFVDFNSPIIVGKKPLKGLQFEPIQVMRAYAVRKRPGTLRPAVDAYLNPSPLDLSDLVEE